MTEPTTYAMKGRLTFSSSGWVILEVPNAIGNGAFQALSEHGIEQPVSSTHGRYNAHISVIRPDEVEAIGGPEMVKARGQSIGFNFGPVREISNPGGWAEISKAWVIEVNSPELMKLRRSLGLGEPKYPFHITFAIRRKHAFKAAESIIHFEKAAVQTAIRKSAIEGKGLFATASFADGDVIVSHFMRRLPGDGRDKWDQSEECRFTNHSNEPNCHIVRDDEYVRLVATRDIVTNEELTADYGSAANILGSNFEYMYQGKPYGGQSSTQSTDGEVHPTSRTILRLIGSDSDDIEDADDTGDRPGRTTGSAHSPDTAADISGDGHHQTGSATGSATGSVDHMAAGPTEAETGSDRFQEKESVVHGGPSGVPGRHTGIQTVLHGPVGDTNNGSYELSSNYRSNHTVGLASRTVGTKSAVNRNQPDYGDRLLKLYERQRKCMGCDKQFKPDEAYPASQRCAACLQTPTLVKEGMDLTLQIATARKATAAPTESQARAGNYAKGKFRMHGMPFTIETPKGGIRSGKDKNGKPWSNKMTADYGYINGTEGKDGDHVDVFVGPDPDTEMVFVIDQIDPDNGRFDEHKVLFGFTTAEKARETYLAHYPAGWQGLKAITPLTVNQFREWLKTGDQTKPLAGVTVKAAARSIIQQLLARLP